MAGINEFMDLQEKRVRRTLRDVGKAGEADRARRRAITLEEIETRGEVGHATGKRKKTLDELDGVSDE